MTPPRRLSVRRKRNSKIGYRNGIARRPRPATRSALRQRQDLIDWVSNYKKRPCADCKKLFPPCAMDLDHLPSFKKRFTISQFVRESGHLPNARALLEAEIAKTEVVCACCHRIRTHRRLKGKKQRWW